MIAIAQTWIPLVKEAHKCIPAPALAVLPYPRGIVIGVGRGENRVGVYLVPPPLRDQFGHKYVVALRYVMLPVANPEQALSIAIQELQDKGGSLGTE
jgi:hypothetical protein